MTGLAFAHAARALGTEARSLGLTVPAFRAPPHQSNASRTIRRYEGGVVIAVVLRERSDNDVVKDLVDGILVANGKPTDAPERRALLRVAGEALGALKAGSTS